MDEPQTILLPRYGQRALADVVPALLAAQGVEGLPNVLAVPAARTVCLLLIDGLGWQLLREHAELAPVLSSMAAGTEPITAGFPSTTATSVASIGTGLTPGQHGVVGYAFAVPGQPLLNALRWGTQLGERRDLREQLVPEQVQPLPTMFERAAADGIEVTVTAPIIQRRSGLTRAVLRGGTFRTGFALGDLCTIAAAGLAGPGRQFCYAYHGDLDLVGHVYGPGSAPWRQQLRFVDQLVAGIAESLPPDGLLVVTADHGMVATTGPDRIDADTEPELLAGVRLLGGEARVRHVYTEPGATPEVAARWAELLGDRALVRTRDEAIAAGWFGPVVSDRVLPRLGDLIVAMLGNSGVVRGVAEAAEAGMIGQHGSLTPAEQYVPLLFARG
ncbi:MAG TPA: nucleotide pyrophosphatase/phosphodiesterase family protein [Pseudonocardiaceae bacterium]|jgi:hypothetical protein|nr:nucleotide pyrophosphatase/phosphodiesterase family protein [Pseudonocardiaceae bacterium]